MDYLKILELKEDRLKPVLLQPFKTISSYVCVYFE